MQHCIRCARQSEEIVLFTVWCGLQFQMDVWVSLKVGVWMPSNHSLPSSWVPSNSAEWWNLNVKSSFPAAQCFYKREDWFKWCLPGLAGQTTVDFPTFVLRAWNIDVIRCSGKNPVNTDSELVFGCFSSLLHLVTGKTLWFRLWRNRGERFFWRSETTRRVFMDDQHLLDGSRGAAERARVFRLSPDSWVEAVAGAAEATHALTRWLRTVHCNQAHINQRLDAWETKLCLPWCKLT